MAGVWNYVRAKRCCQAVILAYTALEFSPNNIPNNLQVLALAGL